MGNFRFFGFWDPYRTLVYNISKNMPPPFTDNMPPPNAQKVISPSNCPHNIEHFLTFLSDKLMCFTDKIPKKSLSPQITPIIYGTFLTSNAQKVIFPQVAPTISSIYLTFLSDNLVCFCTQNFKKVTFPSSWAYNIGNLFDILGWQSSVFLLIFWLFIW